MAHHFRSCDGGADTRSGLAGVCKHPRFRESLLGSPGGDLRSGAVHRLQVFDLIEPLENPDALQAVHGAFHLEPVTARLLGEWILHLDSRDVNFVQADRKLETVATETQALEPKVRIRKSKNLDAVAADLVLRQNAERFGVFLVARDRLDHAGTVLAPKVPCLQRRHSHKAAVLGVVIAVHDQHHDQIGELVVGNMPVLLSVVVVAKEDIAECLPGEEMDVALVDRPEEAFDPATQMWML